MMKLGFIGCGNISDAHLNGLAMRSVEEFKPVDQSMLKVELIEKHVGVQLPKFVFHISEHARQRWTERGIGTDLLSRIKATPLLFEDEINKRRVYGGGTPGMGAYQTAKYAVEGFSEVLNNEVKPFGVRVTIIEPGAFRTDWQGSSMIRASVGLDYEQTVGALNKMREQTDGKQHGDPAVQLKSL
ncbi:SDR family NAD(P)-dependent oxidoreductase [Paenibacillus sp. UNC496MF]|uniref:SDR family NAD(P)-dependent oxidoreductase n=1 Tax=Paenibacillus sp. UNC496MF TaxID=1502753 RepID=UPI000A60FEF5|nr:SDR family NAD(P)-dependent oxidoreductase [Paenibacillus sp. UNC496MF]